MSISSMPIALKLMLMAIAFGGASYDLRTRRIPNWINLSGIVLGLGLNTYFEGLGGAWSASAGLLIALCVYVPLYAIKGMGAGDVKLMAAVGAMAGPQNWLTIFIATALLGGGAALGLLFWRKQTSQACRNLAFIVSELVQGRSPAAAGDRALSIHHARSLKMPHGAVIAAGVGIFLVLHWKT